MTQSKHTEGPWHLRGYQFEELIITDKEDCLHICHVVMDDGFDGKISKQQQKANALVIAAAPELLAALEAIALEAGCIKSSGGLRVEQMALAAIAKARGAK